MSRARTIAVALVLAIAGGCNLPTVVEADTDTDGMQGTSTGFTVSVGSVDETSSSSTGGGPEPVSLLDATLDLETLEQVTVAIVQTGDEVEATVTLSRGYGVAPDGEALVGPARVDGFPEAGAILYTARLEAGPQEGGPCGAEAVSLGVSLHKDEDGAFVAGGVTAYCGAGQWWGVPAIEPLRVSGVVE